MTRKDYRLLAAALLEARDMLRTPEHENAWRITVARIAQALYTDGGFDLNGNRRFDVARFQAAAGYDD